MESTMPTRPVVSKKKKKKVESTKKKALSTEAKARTTKRMRVNSTKHKLLKLRIKKAREAETTFLRGTEGKKVDSAKAARRKALTSAKITSPLKSTSTLADTKKRKAKGRKKK
jgi:hypothetical protein